MDCVLHLGMVTARMNGYSPQSRLGQPINLTGILRKGTVRQIVSSKWNACLNRWVYTIDQKAYYMHFFSWNASFRYFELELFVSQSLY